MSCVILRRLEHDEFSVTPLAAVERDVLVAGVRVEASNAFLIGQERRMHRIRCGRVCVLFCAGYWIQAAENLKR